MLCYWPNKKCSTKLIYISEIFLRICIISFVKSSNSFCSVNHRAYKLECFRLYHFFLCFSKNKFREKEDSCRALPGCAYYRWRWCRDSHSLDRQIVRLKNDLKKLPWLIKNTEFFDNRCNRHWGQCRQIGKVRSPLDKALINVENDAFYKELLKMLTRPPLNACTNIGKVSNACISINV